MVATCSIGPGATTWSPRPASPTPTACRCCSCRRHVRQPPARSGAAAGRALRRPHRHGERRLQAGHPVLGPHHPARAGDPLAAPRRGDDARSGRLRAGVPRASARRAGRGVRLPRPFFEPDGPPSPGPRPDTGQLARARRCARPVAPSPLIIAGGGVHYSQAEDALRAFAERHGVPVVETTAGKPRCSRPHPLNAGPVGATGCTVGQRPGRRGRRRPGRRDAPAGLHDRVVDRVRQRGPVHRAQRRLVRRRQAPRPPAGRRRPGGPARARRALSGWVGRTSWALGPRERHRRLPRLHRRPRRPSAAGASGGPRTRR